MAYTRELTEEEKRFCISLGGVVIFWNHVEETTRLLLHYITRGRNNPQQGHRLDVLISNLGNVSLSEALLAIGDDYEDDLREHIHHCAKLFDANRIYRNHYVHTPITFVSTETHTVAFSQQTTAKGGALRLHQGDISHDQLDAFHDRLGRLQFYLSDVISEVIGRPDRKPLASLEKPPLPEKLEMNRLRLIERKRPPQSSEA